MKPAEQDGYHILDALQNSILRLDDSLVVNYVNATAESLFSNSAANLIGKRFDTLLSQIEPSSILDQLQQPQAMTEHEAVITLSTGQSIVADYSIYPLRDSARQNDILLEIRQLQRQAQFAREELNQLQQQTREQLSRGLAHEINNPLGGIRGAAQLLQKALDNSEWREYTDIIIHEVDRLRALVGNMLGPNNQIKLESVNILEVLEHIRRIILAAEPERILIQRDYDPSIPELEADRDLLIQALLNIARNAVQDIDNTGKIIFKTRIGRRYTIGQVTHPLVVQVDVIDNGRGIASELNDTIFLPMVTDKPEGSGLGLPIAQEIVLRHGGTIQTQNNSHGTTFSIILPLEQI